MTVAGSGEFARQFFLEISGMGSFQSSQVEVGLWEHLCRGRKNLMFPSHVWAPSTLGMGHNMQGSGSHPVPACKL